MGASRSSTPPDGPAISRGPAPAPPALRRADWALRLAVLLFALGLARACFTRTGTAIGSIALLEWDVSHADILFGEKLAAGLILVCAATLLFRPTLPALAVTAAFIMAESWAAVRAGGRPFSDLTPYSTALRYLTPLALIPLILAPKSSFPRVVRCHLSAWILRIGLAVVFLAHGVEAWNLHPQFIDYIIGSGRNLGGFEITESAASAALKIIGAVDIAVALLVLARPWPALLGWLAFWGLVTALARPLSLGFASYPEVLLRASHFLAPLALWQLTELLRRRGGEDGP